MKKRLSIILMVLSVLTVLFYSCSKEDSKIPTVVGFYQESFAMDVDDEVVLRIVSTTAVPAGSTVGFTAGGNMKEGVDYTLSDDKFNFQEGIMTSTVKVKLLRNITNEDVLYFDLQPISFGSLGLLRGKVSVGIRDVVLYTFDNPNYVLTNSVEVPLTLTKAVGSFRVEKELVLEVEVDPASTAEEGVNISFPNGKRVVIPAGRNKGSIKVDIANFEAGKDKLVLRLKEAPMVFRPGNYDMVTVTSFNKSFDRLPGEWKFVAMSNYDWLDMNTSWNDDPPTLLPSKNTANDRLIFDENGLKTVLSGDLKNYFRDGEITFIRSDPNYRQQEGAGFPPPRMTIDLVKTKANVLFSAKEEQIREANVGYRVFTENGKDMLEVTIHDYEPVDFLQNTYSMVKDWGDDPVMFSYPLRFLFEKVVEED